MLNYTQIQEKIKAGTLKYYPADLEKHEKIQAEISQFVPCEVHAIVYQDNENVVQYFTTIIKNDTCGDINVNFQDRYGYMFHTHNLDKLPFMDYLDRGTIAKKYPEQNKIFKLTKKKIYFEIERLEKIYLHVVEESKRKEQGIAEFLQKVKKLGGEKREFKNGAYVKFKHYGLNYTIHDNGYIEQKISLEFYPIAPIDFLLTHK